MIKSLETLATELENKLNGTYNSDYGEYENIHTHELDSIIPNTTFRFKISADTEEYEKGKREGNKVVYYINAIMQSTGSSIEGENPNATNTSVSVSVEYLVPLVSSRRNKKILSAVRALLSDVLSLNATTTETIGNISYFISTQHRIASTGSFETRAMVGESVTLLTYIDYYFVALGVSSSSITSLEIDGEIVNISNIGIARRTLSEGNTPSGQGNSAGNAVPSSKAAVSGTVLVLNIAMPTRCTAFDKKIAEYTLKSTLATFEVKISIPTNDGTVDETFTMICGSAGINGQVGLNASTTVELIEKLS